MLINFLMGSKIESVQDWDHPKQFGGPERIFCRMPLEWSLLFDGFGWGAAETSQCFY